MDERSVPQWAQALGVPAELVSVGMEVDGRWCLVPTVATPETGGPESVLGADLGWEVFWREQGDRFDWARFTDVDVACWYLLGRLAHSQLIRGALAVVAPPTAEPPTVEPPGAGRRDTGPGEPR